MGYFAKVPESYIRISDSMPPPDTRGRQAALYIVLACLTAAAGMAQQKVGGGELSCPASIAVIETAASVDGWKGGSATVERHLEGLSVLNGAIGGTEYDLAPDGQQVKGRKMIVTWHLREYRTMNIFVKCRYRDTSAALSRDLPAAIQTCTFSADTDAHGKIAGVPVAICK